MAQQIVVKMKNALAVTKKITCVPEDPTDAWKVSVNVVTKDHALEQQINVSIENALAVAWKITFVP